MIDQLSFPLPIIHIQLSRLVLPSKQPFIGRKRRRLGAFITQLEPGGGRLIPAGRHGPMHD
jgi:hypothetical protein